MNIDYDTLVKKVNSLFDDDFASEDLSLKSLAFRIYVTMSMEIDYQKKFCKEIKEYNKILDNTLNLAKELKINGSLDLTLFYQRLLEQGYFSVDKKLIYENNNNLYPIQLMLGSGVCRHFSAMLRDLLNKANFKSAVIYNTYGNGPIYYLLNFLDRGNHAISLILDDSGYYAYDVTNHLVFNFVSLSKALSSDFKNTLRINKNTIFKHNINNFDTLKLMYDFFNAIINCFYIDDQSFNYKLERTNDIFHENVGLIDDFYNENKPSIDIIANGLKRKK